MAPAIVPDRFVLPPDTAHRISLTAELLRAAQEIRKRADARVVELRMLLRREDELGGDDDADRASTGHCRAP